MHYKKIITIIIVISFTVSINSFGLVNAFARTSDDVAKEIEEKKEELEDKKRELEEAEESLENSKKRKENVEGRLNQLDADIDYIENQINVKSSRVNALNQEKELKELEKEKRDKNLDEQLVNSYVYWQSEGRSSYTTVLGSSDPIKTGTYYSMVTGTQQESLNTAAVELSKIEERFRSAQQELDKLENQIIALEEEKRQKKIEIEAINERIQEEANNLATQKAQLQSTRELIDNLSEEQQRLLQREKEILSENTSGISGTQPIAQGEYYFQGVGRDLVQGHGIGFSQFGALGASLAGWSYKQIVEFYYPGAKVIKTTDQNIRVVGTAYSGRYIDDNFSLDEYASGIGEVPSTSCEDLGESFPYNNNIWSCWPEEAIKAQLVSARSYGLSRVQRGGSVCPTAACQVFDDQSYDKSTLAQETSLEILSVDGSTPIIALYSSQNNQGNGTADNETVNSNWQGDGTRYSYLTHVDDGSFYYAYAPQECDNLDCAKWNYRTNGYTLQDIGDFINREFEDYFKENGINLGTIQDITFQRDPSFRVQKVTLVGSNQSFTIAGWYFKSLWNNWVYEEAPSGEKDYIYSLTFYLEKG
jgi:predicted  nucleic acid-binding Zn-ribbon protein